jgi:uncharacterized protein with HEPN domain
MRSELPGKTVLAILEVRENIRLITIWASEGDLDAIKADRKTRYAIERAFMAVDAAIRDIPRHLLDEYRVPANLIAGFRNALAHTYDDIMDERVMLTIAEDLPALDASLAQMLVSLG